MQKLRGGMLQAGVDLMAALEMAARDRGGAGGGRKITRRQKAKMPLDVQLRPKRRPPISEASAAPILSRPPAGDRGMAGGSIELATASCRGVL